MQTASRRCPSPLLLLLWGCGGLLSEDSSVRAQAPARRTPPVMTSTAPASSAKFPASWYPPASDMVYTERIEREHPYTATLLTTGRFRNPATAEVKEVVQTTAQMRDGQGRRREEVAMPRPDGHGGTVDAREVSVSDPVSHCDFQWMEPWVVSGPVPTHPIATVTCKPRVERYTAQDIWRDAIVNERRETRDARSSYVSEPLGQRVMEGVPVTGTRRTTTRFDAQGSPTGLVVMEQWYSPEIEELLSLTFTIEGKESAPGLPGYQLTKLRLAEPASALFYPPRGYEIRSSYPGKP